METLQGKAALVTGGQVGTAIAEAFLNSGVSVSLVYRNPARLTSINEKFAGFHDAFLPIPADLTEFNNAKKAVEVTKNRFGGVDFLVNGLGGWTGGKKLHEHSLSEFNKMLSLDAVPTFNIMSAVLPLMMEQRFGRIINFISTQVFGTGANNGIYAASKSAVFALTKAAAEEYKSFGIASYAIAPSTINTESNRKTMPKADVTKWVEIEDIVDAVLFLCGASDSASGTIIKFL